MTIENGQTTPPVPENTPTIENVEKALKEKMLSFQLEYVGKLLQKEIPFPDGSTEQLSFEDIVNRYSDISTDIHQAYIKRTNKVPGGEDEEFEKFDKEILAQIHEAYDSSPATWASQISPIIERMVGTLPESLPSQVDKKEREVLRAGLLRYELRTGLRGLEGMEETGITDQDESIMIHFDPYYKQRALGATSLSLQESFQKLASDIITQYPHIKAVIYESWIADSPMGERIGFHEFQSQFEYYYHGDPFWGQFYDMDGEMNKKRMAKLLETGKAPFKVKGGYLLIKEFLEKYPPKE